EGTIIVELTNPDLVAQAATAKAQLTSAEAQLANATTNLDQQIAAQTSAVANAKSQHDINLAKLTADQSLQKDGIVSPLTVQSDQAAFDQAKNQWTLAQQTLDSSKANRDSTLAPQRAAIEMQRTNYDQFARQLDDLHVKASM